MKKILFYFIVFPMFCFGQNKTIITDCNVEKAIKYSNAKEWIAKTFNDYKSVVQYEDKEECKIILKGVSRLKEEHSSVESIITTTYVPSLNYTITIECKDEKYRFTLDGMSVDVKEISNILGSSSVSNKSYSIKEFIELKLSGEIVNPEEMINKTTNTLNSLSIKLDSLKAIDTSLLKKKEQKRLTNLISSTESNILLYKKNIKEYEYWATKEERRKEDIKNIINLLHSSLSQTICKTNEW